MSSFNFKTTFRANRRRSALFPALSCLMLAGGLSLCRADETPAPKPADTAPVAKQESPATTKPVQIAKVQDAKKDDAKKDDAKKPEEKKADPATPPPPAPGTVTITGLVDVYYGVNARAPKSGSYATITPSGETIKSDNSFLFYNINDREPSLSLGEININRTEGKGVPFGITSTFIVGDSARLFSANEPGGTSSWQNILNLYITKSYKNFTFDFGKWASPIGLDVLESSNNDNYSRTYDFIYGVPSYHAGGRVTFPVGSKSTVQLALVNGWNNVADDNNAKTVYGQWTFKPNANITTNLSYIGGAEGTGAYGAAVVLPNQGSITTNLVDGNISWQFSPSFKMTGWMTYGSGAGSASGTHLSGSWLATVVGARYQINPKWAIAGRLEDFDDYAGAGGAGLRLGLPGSTRMREGTLTLEYITLRSHLVTRLEYRHDQSTKSVFGAGGGTSPDQDTIYLSEVIRF